MKAHITVLPRREVLDPQGDAVRQGLHSLGYDEVSSVKVGRFIELELDAPGVDEARERVADMCKTLLANQVIEDFTFDLEE